MSNNDDGEVIKLRIKSIESELVNEKNNFEVYLIHKAGGKVEYSVDKGTTWSPIACPSWAQGTHYRVAENQPMTVPWDMIEGKWKFAAMDEDGCVAFYTTKPEWYNDQWVLDSEGEYINNNLIKFFAGNVPARNSLVERP